MDSLDIAYITSIVIILLGGAFCIAFFGSKEKTKRDELSNSFRFVKRGGEVIRTSGKPSLFESKKAYYYLEKSPFSADVSTDGAQGADGKTYRAIVMYTLMVMDDTAQQAAESFFGLSTEEIGDMLSEPLEDILKRAILGYDGKDKDALSAGFREKANEALAQFGVSITKINDLRVMEAKQENGE